MGIYIDPRLGGTITSKKKWLQVKADPILYGEARTNGGLTNWEAEFKIHHDTHRPVFWFQTAFELLAVGYNVTEVRRLVNQISGPYGWLGGMVPLSILREECNYRGG